MLDYATGDGHRDRVRRAAVLGRAPAATRSGLPRCCASATARSSTPGTVYDYDVATGELLLRKRQPVLGGYEPADYAQARVWATAQDGTQIPISLVWKRSFGDAGAAPRPVHLYGYGSYEHSIEPGFSVARLSELDRGVVFAVAHVRGGGEMGRQWYEDGKLLQQAQHLHRLRRLRPAPDRQRLHDARSPGRRGRLGGRAADGRRREPRARAVRRASSPTCRSSTRSPRSSTRRCRSR